MVHCRNCGKRVSAQGRLCPACGATLRRGWRHVALFVLCLALVGAGYYLVARVVTVSRIRWQLARLPRPSLAAILPPATPTYVVVSQRSTETRPVPTRIPTATPFRSPVPTATPTSTMTPTAAPTARPATATAAFRLPAVKLLGPASGAEFGGADASVVLSWEPVGELAEDEWYSVNLRYQANNQTNYDGTWTKETSWRLPSHLFRKPDPATSGFEWDVRVMQRTGSRPDGGNQGVPVSAPGEVRTFQWR